MENKTKNLRRKWLVKIDQDVKKNEKNLQNLFTPLYNLTEQQNFGLVKFNPFPNDKY